MDYKKPDRKAIKSWRIGQAIVLLIAACISVPALYFISCSQWNPFLKYIIMTALAVWLIYAFIGLVLFPQLEYRQWAYKIEEDKVVIRHGIFFVKKNIVPIIRIQNITISQGPINRKLGLFKVKLALASGTFEIEGLDKETADEISDNLKARLYKRISEKGVL